MEIDIIRARKIVASTIRLRRINLGLTQLELAKSLKIGRQALSKIESGVSMPRFDTMIQLCEILKLPPYKLFEPLSAESVERGFIDNINELERNKKARELIGRAYKHARESIGYSIDRVAAESAITVEMYKAFENGKASISLDTFLNISGVIGIHMDFSIK